MRQPGILTAVFGETLASLRRLPDFRAAIEALILFLLVMLAGVWMVQAGGLQFDPPSREQIRMQWLSVFLFPVLVEEIAFRGWLPRGARSAGLFSLVAFVVWFPLQAGLGLPTARPEFREPAFLLLVALLGAACTLTRLRSGSIWPGFVIHWGVLVTWLALFGGAAPGSVVQAP